MGPLTRHNPNVVARMLLLYVLKFELKLYNLDVNTFNRAFFFPFEDIFFSWKIFLSDCFFTEFVPSFRKDFFSGAGHETREIRGLSGILQGMDW